MTKPERGSDAAIERVTIIGELDRQTIEAVKLEVRRLGRQFGFEIREAPSATGS